MNHTLPPARNLILCFTLMLAVVAGRLVLAESAPNKTEKPAPEQTEPYNGHPRLFFSGPAEKNRLLAGMSPEREAIWKGVLASIKPEVSAGSGRNFGHNLAATALVFGISGDVAYRDGALAGLRLAMSNTELWGGERLNRAEMLYGLAVAYDTLHDRLSEAERVAVRKKLMAECPRALTGDWRVKILSNQAWVSAAAMACAAYACRGEEPEAERWMKASREFLADHVMLRASDGTPSNEGCQYGAYEGIWGLIHRVVIERGEPTRPKALDDDDTSGFTANYGRFWLHADVPGHRHWLDYGDSHTRTSTGHPVSQALAYYAGLYHRQGRDVEAGVTEWLRQQRLAANGDHGAFTPYHFLWYTDSIKAVSPEGKIPPYHHFRDYEFHIFRDSWEDPKATWFAFKCSPQPSHTFWKVDPQGKNWQSTGHGHPDTGHFSLVADGQWLAVDDGYGGSTVSQHNTLVIDDELQLGDRGGGSFSYRPEKFPALAKVDVVGEVDSTAGHFLTGDMTAAYPNASLVQRHVLVLRQPMRIVVADVIKGGKQAEWLLHTDKKAGIREEGPGHVLVQAGKVELRIQTALPAKPAISIERGKKKTQAITLSAPVASTPFIVALLPGKAAAKPATVTESGFTFPTGETVKWNFKDGAVLCLAEGPNGIVAGQASRIDLPWIKMQSTRPVNISLGKDGKGTLAVSPGDKAKVHLVINGREKEITVAPGSYVDLPLP